MSKQEQKKQFMYTTCSEHVVFVYCTGKLMSNLLSYCGLVELRISASEKDLPVSLLLRSDEPRNMAFLKWQNMRLPQP